MLGGRVQTVDITKVGFGNEAGRSAVIGGRVLVLPDALSV